MDSLFEWLHRHVAPHLQQLDLNLVAPYEHGEAQAAAMDPQRLEEEVEVTEALPECLVALLSAVCGAGQLRDLHLYLVNMQVRAQGAEPAVLCLDLCAPVWCVWTDRCRAAAAGPEAGVH